MKRGITVLVCLLLLLSGCQRQQDFFEEFRSPFEAHIKGQLGELFFEALVKSEGAQEGDVAPMTVTFYAPDTLTDTVFYRDGEGKCTVRYGEVTVPAPDSMAALLFSLFPTGGATGAEVDALGNTVVNVAEKQVIFSAAGVPIRIESPDVRVEIVAFERETSAH